MYMWGVRQGSYLLSNLFTGIASPPSEEGRGKCWRFIQP